MKSDLAVTFNCEEKNVDEIDRQTKIYYFIEWWNSEYIVVEVERKAFCLEWSTDLTEIGGEDGLRYKYLLNSEESSQSDRRWEESSFYHLHEE